MAEKAADLLKKSLEWGVLEPEELYGTEKQVIGRLLSEERCAALWNQYRLLSQIEVTKERPAGRYCVRVPSKLRWIDPLFLLPEGGAARISEVSEPVRKGIEDLHRTDFDVWICAPEGAEAAAELLQNG